MPANFQGSLRRPVFLKPGETCSWARHLKWGFAARSLWRQLNKFDSVAQDGSCRSSIKSICDHSAKFNQGKKVGRFSYDRTWRLLDEFERAGLIGPRMGELDDPDQPRSDDADEFQVHGQKMHDLLCERVGNMCVYRGWNYAASLTKKEHMVTSEVTKPATSRVTSEATNEVTNPVTSVSEKGNEVGNELKTPQVAQNPHLQGDPKSVSASIGALNQKNQVKSEETGESGQALQAGQTTSAKTAEAEADAFVSFPMTDQRPETPRPCGTDQTQRIETIGDHFRGNLSIEDISDNEIYLDHDGDGEGINPDLEDWETILGCCEDAVRARIAQPYLGRKTNGDIMADAMALLRKNHGEDAPKCWYAVIKKLRESPAVRTTIEEESSSVPLPPPVEDRDIFDEAMESAAIDFDDFKAYFFGPAALFAFADWTGDNKCRDHRAGWKLLDKVLSARTGQLPGPLVRLREWLWENDAMPNKPAAPTWK